jgi:sigma-E factor negative regulatory protein RseC
MGDTINYCGIVERIEEDSVYVKIIQHPACAGCHSKSACVAASAKEQHIEVNAPSGAFRANERVMLEGSKAMGRQAVWSAFVVPMMLVVGVVAGGTAMGWEESVSALAGLFLLFLYYAALYLSRAALKKRFVFTIKKINPHI